MANSYISKLKVPNDNTTYYVRDSEAQTSITNLQNLVAALGTPLDFRGVTTVPILDNATTPSTYQAASLTPPSGKVATDTIVTGTVAIYGSKEFVWDGSKWHEFGSAQISGDTASVLRGDVILATASASASLGTPTRVDVVSDVTIADSTSSGAVGFITGFTDSPLKYVGLTDTVVSGKGVVTGVANNGTVSAVTAYTPTSQHLDLTSASKITGNTSVSFLPVSAVTNGTFSDYVQSSGASPSWSFSVANETLTISGANGSVPTFNTTASVCKSVTAGAQATATNTTYSNIDVADGTVSSSGTGDSVLTGLGAPVTAAVIKSTGLALKYLDEGTGVGPQYKYVSVTKTSSTNSPIKTAPAVTIPALSVTKTAGASGSTTVNAYVEASS